MALAMRARSFAGTDPLRNETVPPPVQQSRIDVNISLPDNTYVDSDTRDPHSLARSIQRSNDSISDAQSIGLHSDVFGAVSTDSDFSDYFVVNDFNITSPLEFTLDSREQGDLDLLVYDGLGNLVGDSLSGGASESGVCEQLSTLAIVCGSASARLRRYTLCSKSSRVECFLCTFVFYCRCSGASSVA